MMLDGLRTNAGVTNGRSRAGMCRPVCGIVPPQILEAVAQNHDDTRVREAAVSTLAMSQSFRSARIGLTESRRPASPAAWWARRAWRRLELNTVAPVVDCQPERTIFDAQQTQRLPGRRIRGEGDPPSDDVTVNEAFDGLGDTFDFFCEVFSRDSIDGRGLPLNATVHFERDFDNAFWDGQRMVFGDGDGVVFNRFTSSIDVIGHELSHGVTEAEAGLIYWGQAGALNESVSDVFGSLVKQFALGQTAEEADWLIGAELLADGINGQALRSMSEPGSAFDDPRLGGRDSQPGHMSGYVRTLADNAGVHTNSGIPNRAFFEAAIRIGGPAWERAGRIWFATLTDPLLRRNSQFQGFANLTLRSAARLFGFGGAEYEAVRDGWAAVGITAGSARALWWVA